MVVYNAATRELTAKIVYYGPGLGGKTTNLQVLHDRLEPGTVGKLLNLSTQTDRTIYFDLLPVELGDIKGYKIRFQLATVPGQSPFNETRRVVLRGADGIVFVADSQWTMLPKNLESWQNLKDNLKANGVSFEGIPVVIQYNKRDLTDILSVDAMQEALGLSSYPFVEAIASAGRGVTETFKLISKLTFVDLLRRLQGRRPEEGGTPPARKEKDDLLSWKESLLKRGSPGTGAPVVKRLSLVPSAPEEAPFDAGEESHVERAIDSEGPFGEATGSARPAPANAPATPAAAQSTHPEAVDRLTEKIDHAQPPPKPPAAPTISADTAPGGTAIPPPPAPPAIDEAKIRGLETRLAEFSERTYEEATRIDQEIVALTARFEAFERDARALGKSLGEKQESSTSRLAALEQAAGREKEREKEAETRVRTLEEHFGSAEKRQRTAEDDVAMALRSLAERGEKLHQRLEEFGGQLEALESALQEKTSQGRREAEDIRAQIETLQAALEEKTSRGMREAEDIRTQIAPLLEAREQHSEERILAELDRLRESLAEALGDLSERLRRAVRGI